eukprot:COSAG04_NODE_202_length_20432_cov_7.004525_1_plen_49_part_10
MADQREAVAEFSAEKLALAKLVLEEQFGEIVEGGGRGLRGAGPERRDPP